MDFSLRQIVVITQILNNYMPRTLLVPQASHHSILLCFLLVVVTAVEYDYSK